MKKVLLVALGILSVASVAGVAMASPVGGGVCRRARVWAHDTNDYSIELSSGETTRITVQGNGHSELDVYVYDENGNLVGSDAHYGDDGVVWIRPRWTGRFTIRVVNRGGDYNDFTICAE